MLRFVKLFLLLMLFLPSAAKGEAMALPASRAQISMSFAPLVKQTAPAVVNIYTSKLVRQRVFTPFMDDPLFQQFFAFPSGMTRERMENSLGSGVIVRSDGLVVTSAHVIQGADEIRIVLHDRREFSARILTTDSKTDLAVLKIDGLTEKLPALALQDSDTAEVGDLVLAIGNPFGVGQTVTSGIISATARTDVAINDLNYFIQTDAAINPGNSGGALVGLDGKLLGINAAIYSQSGGNMGIGFAVPSNMVRTVIAAVEQGNKRVVRPWLGIDGQSVTPELASSLGLERPSGIVVNKILPASPLGIAGVKVGDVIETLNGKAVEDMAALRFRAATLGVGNSAQIGIVRAGRTEALNFNLLPPPELPQRQETILGSDTILMGVRVANLSPAVADELGLDDGLTGVVVTGVKRRSALTLQIGDQILAVNQTRVTNVAVLQAALQEPAARWLLQIQRGGQILRFVVNSR